MELIDKISVHDTVEHGAGLYRVIGKGISNWHGIQEVELLPLNEILAWHTPRKIVNINSVKKHIPKEVIPEAPITHDCLGAPIAEPFKPVLVKDSA